MEPITGIRKGLVAWRRSPRLRPCALCLHCTATGRDDPNSNPHLEEPDRFKFNPFNPCAMLKEVLGPEIFKKFGKAICVIVLLLCCWFMVPLIFSDVIANVISG